MIEDDSDPLEGHFQTIYKRGYEAVGLDPEAWRRSGQTNLRAARILYAAAQKEGDAHLERRALLMAGLAVELLLKACHLREFGKTEKTHNLIALKNKLKVDFSKDDEVILQMLSEAVIWFGRYPLPSNLEKYFDFSWRKIPAVIEEEWEGNTRTRRMNWKKWPTVDNVSRLIEKIDLHYNDTNKQVFD